MPNLPPSHEIDTRYMGHLLTVLEDMADDVAEGWTEFGAIINQHEDRPGVRTYIPLVWEDEIYDRWFPGGAVHAFVEILADWQQELTDKNFPNWTGMFLGAVVQSDGNIRTIWLPEYVNGGGRWKIIPGVANWPKVEAELRKLADREGKPLSDDAASGRGDAHLIDSARRRILGNDYEPTVVFGGKYADAAPYVEHMRESIADPSNRAHDWQSAYRQLDPDGKEFVNQLEIEEADRDPSRREPRMSRPEFYYDFERPVVREVLDSPRDANTGGLRFVHGVPENVISHIDPITSEEVYRTYPPHSFQGAGPGVGPLD